MPYPTTDFVPYKVTYAASTSAHGAQMTVEITAPGYSGDPDWPDRLDEAVRALRDSICQGDPDATSQIWRTVDANIQGPVTVAVSTPVAQTPEAD